MKRSREPAPSCSILSSYLTQQVRVLVLFGGSCPHSGHAGSVIMRFGLEHSLHCADAFSGPPHSALVSPGAL